MIYRIINYWTLPYGLLLLFIILICKLAKTLKKIDNNDKPEEKSNRKELIISFIIGFVVVSCILSFPYEKIFKFKTPQEILNYEYPLNKIIKTYDYKDYAYILYSNILTDTTNRVNYIKKSNKWMSNDNFPKMIFLGNGCIGKISEIKEKNVIGIDIDCFSKKKDSILVEDSLSSKFDKFTTKDDDGLYTYNYFTTINTKVTNNYIVKIDGKKYKIRNCMKKKCEFCYAEGDVVPNDFNKNKSCTYNDDRK